MVDRVHVYIDGGNFHHLVLKKLGVLEINFDFDGFCSFLANSRSISDHGKRYYVGTVREHPGDPRSKQAMSQQTSFFAKLKAHNWEIKTSKLRTRIESIIIDNRVQGYADLLEKGVKKVQFTRTREKGIDVKLATDVLVGAVDDQYDVAIIVSSDGDLVPAIDWVRRRYGKSIEYVGFSIRDMIRPGNDTRPAQALITRSDIQRILVESDMRRFVRQKLV